MTRVLPLYLWVVCIVVSSVYLPQLRESLAGYGGLRLYLLAGLGTLGVAALAFALARTTAGRFKTLGRLALLAAAGALGWKLLLNPDPRARLIEVAHLGEYGILGFLAFRAFGAAPALAFPVAVGLLDETVQWIVPSRTGEVRDVALNALAGSLGTGYSGIVLGFSDERGRAGSSALAAHAGVLLLGVGFFLNAVHRGQLVAWSDLTFVSHYPQPDLDRLASARRLEWSALSREERLGFLHPERKRWAFEDFYVTEALRHIQARNDASLRGDTPAAAAENLILERFYNPVLDAVEAHRRDLDPAPPPGYRSPALSHLWAWLTPLRLWSVVLALETVLVLAFYRSRGAR